MSTARVENATTGETLHDDPEYVTTFLGRLRGFMFSKPGDRCKIFLFMPAREELIHMFFVRGPIDCVALDGQGTVVAVKENLRPWRTWRMPKASALLELPAGTVARTGTGVGHRIVLPSVTIRK